MTAGLIAKMRLRRAIEAAPRWKRFTTHPSSDHRPGQERQVEREGHEIAHSDLPRHDQAPAVPEHDHHPRAGQQSHDGVEGARRVREVHVALQVHLVQRCELGSLGPLLPVGPHDPDAAQVLLHHRRQRRELLLDSLEADVDRLPEPRHHRRQDRQRHQRRQRQRRTDVDHDPQPDHEADDGVRRVHDRRARRLPYRQRVVGGQAHEVAGPVGGIEAGVEAEQVPHEVVPQIDLDPPAQPVEDLAHPVARRAPRDGRGDDQQRVRDHRAAGQVRVGSARGGQRVNGQLDQERLDEGERVGEDDQHHSPGHGPPVGPEVGEDGLEFAHRRRVGESSSAVGESS